MKHNGILEYTGLEKTFAEELALDLDEDADNVLITLNYLLSCGLIETSDNVEFFLPYAVENVGSEGSSAQRNREYRERLKEKASLCDTSVTDARQLRDGEIEKEIEIDKSKSKSKKVFTPPSLDEVKAYCEERGNNVDPQHFIDHYSARGWMLGKNKMKDWKAAVRTWERNEFNDGKSVHRDAETSTNAGSKKWNLVSH